MFKLTNLLKKSKKFAKPLGIATAASLLLSQSGFLETEQKAKFCGIVGYIGKEKKAFQIISEGISILENRGYDSVGIGSVIGEKLEIDKYASGKKEGDCIERLLLDKHIMEKYKDCNMAIGHTRWATCGGKEDFNAHPHTDQDGQVTLVHNGTILNHREIKNELIKKGIEFTSETDTEVIAQLIGSFLTEGMTPQEALEHALGILEGTWGLVVIFRSEPEKIFCTQNGSHLVVGLGDNEVYLASEARAFERYTRILIDINDGELLEIGLGDDGEYTVLNKEIKSVKSPQKERLAKGGYTTFFEKEIFEQKQAVYNALGKSGRICTNTFSSILGGLFEAQSSLKGVENLMLFGCGTSNIACEYASYFFKILGTFTTVQVMEASNVEEHDIPSKMSFGIFVSQSGETKDLHRILEIFKKKGYPTFGIVNVIGSLIAKDTDFGCYMNAGPEQSVPSTKTFLASVVCQILVALWFAKERNGNQYMHIRQKICYSLLALNCFIGNMLKKSHIEKAKELALILNEVDSIFVVGKGLCMPMAKEAALKLKELTYIHAEAVSSGNLKHGPIALIDPKKEGRTKIILFVMNDSKKEEMILSLEEVKARNAYTIVITDCYHEIDPKLIDFPIKVPPIEYIGGILAIIPIQLTCLEIAKMRGINPDRPRNLAKCVTVL